MPATASGRGANIDGHIRVTARALARLLPLAFAVALPALVLAAPEATRHRAGVSALPEAPVKPRPCRVKLARIGPRGLASIRPEPFALGSAPSRLRCRPRAKWLQVRDELALLRRSIRARPAAGPSPKPCPPAARRFLDLIDGARGKQDGARSARRDQPRGRTWRSATLRDLKQHGADVWTSLRSRPSPRGEATAKDYAIAKYLALARERHRGREFEARRRADASRQRACGARCLAR